MSSSTERPSRVPLAAGDAWTGLILLAAVGLFGAYAVYAGLPAGSLARLLVTTVVVQWLPGILLWRFLRPRDGWLVEDLAAGFACGFALSVPAQVIGGFLDSAVVSASLPLLVALALLVVPAARRRILDARWTRTPWWLPVVIAVASLGCVRDLSGYFRQNRLDWPIKTAGRPHVDQYFQVALTNELRFRGPAGWPMIAGERLDYHWFTHAWMGQLAAVADVPAAQVVLRFAPALLPVLAVAAIAALALRVTGRASAAAVAAVVSMFTNYVVVWRAPGTALPITPFSPTLAPSLIVLTALVAVLAFRLRGERRDAASAAAVVALAIVAAGTKGSATPLVVAGLALAVAAAVVWDRRAISRPLVDFALVTVGLLVTMKVIFNGSTDGLVLNPTEAVQRSWPVAAIGGTSTTAVLLAGGVFLVLWGLSKAVLGVVLLWRPDERLGRRDPIVWILLGSVIAGAFGPALFVQPGVSQNYFRIQALPLAAVLSAAGLTLWWHNRSRVQLVAAVAAATILAWMAYQLPISWVPVRPHRPSTSFLVVLLGVVLCLLAGAVVAALDRRQRALTAATVTSGALLLTGAVSVADSFGGRGDYAGPVLPGVAGAVRQGQLDAATYIGNHSSPDALVMTNRHCTTPRPVRGVCESRWYLVAAFSGRQVLVEGWGYSPPITAAYVKGRTSITAPFNDPALLRLNDGFYTSPTPQAARELWNRGVRWIYVDKLTTPRTRLAPYARLVYQNPAAAVWTLNRP
ncbi:hypothetical protein G9U51_05270 [Calidifontibacter sp. DB0510]|uniref:Uncharacterized protein n=1 Tax=Metallococcus carri TaxID=1656884 RepID=A0A967AY82_9MICO|nr:hypothetical protein [Metallococcus carri]NHN55199.1 hypothetical protein [Metallococcus carri]NOP36276.1 hypothetical protein [Calidifontibacter sp. DB2511S]